MQNCTRSVLSNTLTAQSPIVMGPLTSCPRRWDAALGSPWPCSRTGSVPPHAAQVDRDSATHVTRLAHMPGHEAEPRHRQAPGRAGRPAERGAGTWKHRQFCPGRCTGAPASCSPTGQLEARQAGAHNAKKKRQMLKIVTGRGEPPQVWLCCGAGPGTADLWH